MNLTRGRLACMDLTMHADTDTFRDDEGVSMMCCGFVFQAESWHDMNLGDSIRCTLWNKEVPNAVPIKRCVVMLRWGEALHERYDGFITVGGKHRWCYDGTCSLLNEVASEYDTVWLTMKRN